MSQAKRPFPSIRAISPPISTSPFSEDVSGETPIFDIKRLKTKLSRSHFLEDVSGKTAILRGTYPDKNGKRRFSELACARADGFAPNTHVCTWGAVAGLPIHAQMVAIGNLCLVVACGCVGQVLRVACARVRA